MDSTTKSEFNNMTSIELLKLIAGYWTLMIVLLCTICFFSTFPPFKKASAVIIPSFETISVEWTLFVIYTLQHYLNRRNGA